MHGFSDTLEFSSVIFGFSEYLLPFRIRPNNKLHFFHSSQKIFRLSCAHLCLCLGCYFKHFIFRDTADAHKTRFIFTFRRSLSLFLSHSVSLSLCFPLSLFPFRPFTIGYFICSTHCGCAALNYTTNYIWLFVLNTFANPVHNAKSVLVSISLHFICVAYRSMVAPSRSLVERSECLVSRRSC